MARQPKLKVSEEVEEVKDPILDMINTYQERVKAVVDGSEINDFMAELKEAYEKKLNA